jgi:hypothetical protein
MEIMTEQMGIITKVIGIAEAESLLGVPRMAVGTGRARGKLQWSLRSDVGTTIYTGSFRRLREEPSFKVVVVEGKLIHISSYVQAMSRHLLPVSFLFENRAMSALRPD